MMIMMKVDEDVRGGRRYIYSAGAKIAQRLAPVLRSWRLQWRHAPFLLLPTIFVLRLSAVAAESEPRWISWKK